ncbi:glutamyl-Q tRNA(Asp) synthetase [mine drainage metagenome]|uniref:Glutamyl-Q tRNA(Asp) synthetase n=1 Tax=mine drainage metagenome TaxID=410659 RepID=A0A1J5SFY6_9ZZZZ
MNHIRQRSRGRFAPSPTGPLHFGSLVAAVGSFLEARSAGGEWLLRMEDLDRPRCRDAAASDILRTLEAFGFEWHGEILWQSRRDAAYRDALERLRAAGRVFACACSRRELADSALAPGGAPVYPGTCRAGLPPGKAPRAQRLRVDDERIAFDDAVQGAVAQDLADAVGDFVLLRADGIFAYQLAVVVDDGEQGITQVVRGADLLDSTPRQILLQRLLGWPTPAYAHLPAAIDAAGEKLSKQTRAAPLTAARPMPALLSALRFLGQEPPAELAEASLAEFWRWATAHWQLARVPRRRILPASE